VARIVGGVATSHIPSIGKAIAKGLVGDPYWTGGLSHQLDGTRAGFINKRFDKMCLEKIVKEPELIARYSIADLIRQSGAQGVELIMWLVMRGALTGDVSEIHSSYHVPISNTASAVMLLENKTRELVEII
jgi:protocatechuate 4,5-dioxygenase beta chain